MYPAAGKTKNGRYQIKLEIYNAAGAQIMPGASTFTFIVPNGTNTSGTVLTRLATTMEVQGGGFVFPLHVDNRICTGYIEAPSIGTNSASDECGFLLYSPMDTTVRVGFHASHPADFAMFRFFAVRGVNYIINTIGEVDATSVFPFTGDGAGNFYKDFLIADLLSINCPDQAAFSENLRVLAKATRGWHHRIHGYDAYVVRAFALAPE